MKLKHLIVIFGFITIFGASTLAQTTSNLPNPGLLPDHPLFMFQNIFEGLQHTFAFSPEAKVNLHLQLAEKRLAELNLSIAENKTNLVPILTESFEKEVNDMKDELSSTAISEENVAGLAEHVAQETYKHKLVLEGVLAQAPEQAKEHIEHAINVSSHGHDEAVGNILEHGSDTGIVNVTFTVDDQTFTQTFNVTPKENIESTTETTKVTTEPPTKEEAQQTAENNFEYTVCSILPNTATHILPNDVGVLIPQSLSDELGKMGDSITFRFSHSVSVNETGGTYYDGGWAHGGDPNTYVMVIPFTAKLADDNGNIATEAGGIKLTFEGPLQPLIFKSKTASSGRPGTVMQGFWNSADTSRDQCRYWIDTCEWGVVPTFSRTGCKVDLEKSCPDKEGYKLCGQCHFSDFYGDIAADWRVVSNLGQCRYCQSGTTCNWGSSGICAIGFSCISSGGGGGGGDTTYYVSCSQCRTTPPTYSYRGGSYEWCNYYYNECVASGCGRILDNCR